VPQTAPGSDSSTGCAVVVDYKMSGFCEGSRDCAEPHCSAKRRRVPAYYSVIEEIVEGFVEGFRWPTPIS
jgi:hypothetical protein